MTVKLGYTIVAGGLLLGLSGCSSSGGGFANESTTHSTHVVTPNKTQNQSQKTTPSQNQGNIATPNRNTNNQNNPAHSAFSTSNFGISTSLADKQPLNITYIARPSAEFIKQTQRAFDRTNQIRKEKGLPLVKYDDNVAALAQMRATELATSDQFGHTRQNGELDYGYLLGSSEWLMGNLAAGSATGDAAINQWVNSPKHYEVMLKKDLETLGVGLAYNPNSKYKYYWVLMFGFKGAKPAIAFIDKPQSNPNPLQQVVINGNTIPLTLDKAGEWQQITKDGQGWVNGYQHTRFGVVTPQGVAESHLYYQGQRTADVAIPKSGTATYNGTALIVKDGKVNPEVKSEFTANFGTRKLDGKLTQNNATLYNLSADINGGAFASKADAPVQIQGAFFGQNAQELSGAFKDTKTNTKGVFGAKQ